MKKMKALAFAVACGVSGGAMAVTQGGLGTEANGGSEGSFDINLTVGAVARVFGLDDIDLTRAADAASGEDSAVCIYTNATQFDLTVDSEFGFQLRQNGQSAGDVGATYSIDFLQTNGGSSSIGTWGSSNLADGATENDISVIALAGSDSELTGTCSTGNVRIAVAADLSQGVAQGNYSDTVTVTVAPN